uniref:Uncharacterized protein n=1 Tax=Arundo donax TaxID=35708 RepID=A0A0A9BET3_ARUDO
MTTAMNDDMNLIRLPDCSIDHCYFRQHFIFFSFSAVHFLTHL